MKNYENMSKEELIAEIEYLKDYKEFAKKHIDVIAVENAKLHNLLKSIQFLLDNSYNNIRNNYQ